MLTMTMVKTPRRLGGGSVMTFDAYTELERSRDVGVKSVSLTVSSVDDIEWVIDTSEKIQGQRGTTVIVDDIDFTEREAKILGDWALEIGAGDGTLDNIDDVPLQVPNEVPSEGGVQEVEACTPVAGPLSSTPLSFIDIKTR